MLDGKNLSSGKKLEHRVTLIVSLVEAFLILPHHLLHAMQHSEAAGAGRFRVWFDTVFERFRRASAGRLVAWAVTWRYASLGLLVSLLLVTLSLVAGGSVKSRAFPELEGNVVEARLLLAPGTPLARTQARVAQLTDAVARINQDWATQQVEGQNPVRNVTIYYNRNSDAHESGPHVATVVVDLLEAEKRHFLVDQWIQRWQAEVGQLPDVVALTFTKPQLGPAGRPIDIRLRGESLVALKEASLALQEWLSAYRGVHDLFDDLRPGKSELRLRLREGAMMLGFTAQDVAQQVRAAFQGRKVREIQVGAEGYEVEVRLASASDGLADLDDFYLSAKDGSQVPLPIVVRVVQGRGFSRIARVNGLRTVTLRGRVDTSVANVQEVIGHLRQAFLPELRQRFPGVQVQFEGEVKEGGGTGASMRRNFLIGLFGVYLLLAFQFRSYLEPVLVMAVIPMGMVGALWGHWFMGLELSMPSIMGLASLAGVVVNDSILLVLFIKENANRMSVVEAAKRASYERFRAIFLTSLTTVVGLLPLLLETSLQAQVLIPLAVSLAFGLFSATMLALIVVPVLYTILDDFGWLQKN